MLVPVDHINFLARFETYVIVVYNGWIIYDITLGNSCRAIIRFDNMSPNTKLYEGYLLFGRQRVMEINWLSDPVFTSSNSDLIALYTDLEKGLNEIATNLLNVNASNQLRSLKK